jgi:hypothetical protein
MMNCTKPLQRLQTPSKRIVAETGSDMGGRQLPKAATC